MPGHTCHQDSLSQGACPGGKGQSASSCHSRHETWGQGSEKSGCPGCSGVQVVPPASAGMKQKGSGVGEDSGRGCRGWRHCGTQKEASRGPVCTQPTQRPWQSWSECQPVRAE